MFSTITFEYTLYAVFRHGMSSTFYEQLKISVLCLEKHFFLNFVIDSTVAVPIFNGLGELSLP